MISIIIISAAIIIADQLTKYWAQSYLSTVNSIPIIGDILQFKYITNTGAAFGIFSDAQTMFLILTPLAIILMLYILIKYKPKHWMSRLSFAFMIPGALGNFIDRIIYGHVRDFIYFKSINFAIFNVADMAVVTGAIALGIYLLFLDKGPNALFGTDKNNLICPDNGESKNEF